MTTPSNVLELVERFDRDKPAYKSPLYNETQTRQEFIDPLFGALGWDIGNRGGAAAAFREVVLEYSMKIGAATKAPDYLFQLGGNPRFFVEAKKPSVNLKDDTSPAFQLRRYAWSATLPLSVLTDFEEFVVYDCRVEPDKKDKATTARMLYIPYTEYADKWDSIAELFSREAVLGGSLEKFAQEQKAPKGATAVDVAFLREIEGWRELLAKNIAIWNPELTQRELNYAVQMTIDRIIFLRICEDRGIEPYGKLQRLLKGGQLYKQLVQQFRDADDRYNSGLFHFASEKGREEPDSVTPGLYIDDEPLAKIVRGLYYPDSPYEFSVLPVEILGNVYEQFLGKVIHLTTKHEAVVEEKPEVRKAGGVYYTPSYIVDYIIKNTVGRLLEGKTPREAAKLRIVDPACGSGSFLLGAYQHLLDWYLAQYVVAGPAKHKKELYQGPSGEWKLTSAARKRILLDNIYGVDIDAQAVEVTKLSLSLKVLEGESEQTVGTTRSMFNERALPDLSDNIKCGNSLIGPDFYDDQQSTMLTEAEQYRINVFDWEGKDGFREIMKAGGFDAVIGNPPYIPIEMISEAEKSYFLRRHPQLERKYDSSVIFILSLLDRLSSRGLLGFISSLTWQTGENFSKLREHLFTKTGVVVVINLPFDVFKDAYVDTGIYVISKKPTSSYRIYRFPKKERTPNLNNIYYTEVSRQLITAPEYKIILEPKAQAIASRVASDPNFALLGDFTISTQGLAGNRFERTDTPIGDKPYPFLEVGQVYRYVFEDTVVKYTDLSDKKSLQTFYDANPKILIRRVINRQDRLMSAFTDRQMVFKKDINPFIITNDTWHPYFVLGILNSQLVSYLYVNTSSIATKDDFRQTTLAELRRLPIPRQNLKEPSHQQVVTLVERMLDLQKREATAKTAQEKTVLSRQIEATDKQIDKLVCELYGLSKDEIAIVEQATM